MTDSGATVIIAGGEAATGDERSTRARGVVVLVDMTLSDAGIIIPGGEVAPLLAATSSSAEMVHGGSGPLRSLHRRPRMMLAVA